jgi:ABC-type nitrate/sulfonate/bicarbonate transport system substrate-binding protein
LLLYLQAFSAAFLSYWLIKIVPVWGLSLVAVTIAFFAPLVYINNREIIDEQIDQAQKMVNAQASQVRELAHQHTAQATDFVKQYASDYSSKAQEYIGHKNKLHPASGVKRSDFPQAPTEDPVRQATASSQKEPLLAE